jgi:cyanophycinase
MVAKVRAAHGVFFSGGAQERIVDVLQPEGKRTPLLEAIWELFNSGGVVAGTSAGAAIMSETMFRDAQDVLRVLKTGSLVEGKEIDRGLGFVGPELFVDQHFLKRGRIGRMLPLMVQKGYKLGIGVEENTGAIVRGHEVEVIGAKGVVLVDLSQATNDPHAPYFNLKNARITYLDKGDRHDLKTGVTTPSQEKMAGSLIDPNAADFRPYFRRMPFVPDILGDNAIANAMGNLLDNRQGEALGLAFAGVPLADDPEPDLGFEFRLKRGPESRGWYTGAFGGEDYTVLNLGLDITPVKMRRPLYEPLVEASAPAAPPVPAGAARSRAQAAQAVP